MVVVVVVVGRGGRGIKRDGWSISPKFCNLRGISGDKFVPYFKRYLQWNLYKVDTIGMKESVRSIELSTL